LKTLLYVALCLVVPPVWALVTYYVFGLLHDRVKTKGSGPGSRTAE
jgi:hypothetical protein